MTKVQFEIFLAVLFLSVYPGKLAQAQNRKCRIEVSQVLEARIYRGPPYMLQMLERDPKHADLITSESHGDHHLTCGYKILMNGRPYRYRSEFPNTLLDLKESYCETSKVKKEVRDRILQFTNRCKDPQAQPTWGYPLEPLFSNH